jgi:outer membrane protein
MYRQLRMIGFLGALCAASGASAVTLDQLHAQLMASDPQVLRADIGVEVLQSRIAQSRAELFPKLSTVLSASKTEREQFAVEDAYQGEDYALVLSQSVFDRPLWLEVQRQELLAEARVADRTKILQERRMALVSAYLQWLEASARADLIGSRLQAVNRRLEQVDALYARQQLNITQVLSVKSERDRVQAELAQNKAEVVRSASMLKSLVGEDFKLPDESLDLPVKTWPFSPGLIEAAQQRLSEHSLIIQAERQRAASGIALSQAESLWLPKLNARLQTRRTNIGASEAETFPVETDSLQLTLTWDLFDSGRRSARIREAELLARDSDLALVQAEREVMRLQDSSVYDVARYRESWQAALVDYESSRELVMSADRSFELGVGTVGDSLRALERLIDSEIRLTSRWLEAVFGVTEIAKVNERLDTEFIATLSVLLAVE